MLNENFVYVAVIITILANIPYMVDTLKGETKPNRVTFILWSAMPIIAYFAQKSEKSGPQALFTLCLGLIPLAILVASFFVKRAYWAITKFDVVCGIISVLAIVLWVATGKGIIALVLSIVADFFAALPTIIKSYKFPKTETMITYAFEGLACIIVILTVQDWKFVNYGFAVYALMMNLLFTTLLIYPRVPDKRSHLQA